MVRQYIELYAAFDAIDSGEDNRISIKVTLFQKSILSYENSKEPSINYVIKEITVH